MGLLDFLKMPRSDHPDRKAALQGRSQIYNLLDNIIGFDDDRVTPGEAFGTGLRENPVGLLSSAMQGATDDMRGLMYEGESLQRPEDILMMAAAPMAPNARGLLNYDPNVMNAIKAYHGSPHSFDKFSMDKIGTGEGAQAYGHGLYLAEAEKLAKHYRDKLSGSRLSAANRRLDANDGDINAAISSTSREIERLKGLPDDAGSKKYAFIKLNEEALEDLQRMSRGDEVGVGSMYEVNVNAPESDFIDYDARLDEQSDLVKSILGTGEETAGSRLKRAYDNEMFGGDMLGQDRATPAELSKGLLGRGIKGIRYLDANSRGMGYKINLSHNGKPYPTEPIEAGSRRQAEAMAKEYQEKGFGADIEANGNRNLVVFDDQIISIVKKYGIAGAAAMLGVSAMDVEQAMAQGAPQPQPQGLLGGAQ